MGPTDQGTVPSAPSGGVAGPDILNLLQSTLGGQQHLAELAKAAATPIPGGHSGQLPLSMNPTPSVAPQAPLDNRQVVGRGNARAQGIGNAITGVMNAISGVSTAVDNKKKLEVASATQTLLTSQQAVDQAKQILQSDPNNQAAKDAIEHNMNIMNGILANDKTRKAIAKGMQIDFTDPSANKTLEHDGVAQGKEMAKKSLSYAEQFQEKTPTTMQPNVQAQAQYQAAMKEQEFQTKAMQAFIPLIRAQMAAQTAENRDKANLTKEQLRQDHEDARAYQKSEDAWRIASDKIQAQAQRDKTQFGYKLAEQTHAASLSFQKFRQELQFKSTDLIALSKANNEFQTSTATREAAFAATLTSLQQARQDAASGDKGKGIKPDPTQAAAIDEQIKTLKEAQANFKSYKDNATKMYNKMAGVTSDGSNSSSANKSTLGSASPYLDEPTDESIDEDSEDQ